MYMHTYFLCIYTYIYTYFLSLNARDLPNPGTEPRSLHCRQILYQLSHKRSPRILEWVAFPFSRGSSQPRSPTLQADSLPAEPQQKPKNTGVGSLSLLQQIFPTQELNQSPALQEDSLPTELSGKPSYLCICIKLIHLPQMITTVSSFPSTSSHSLSFFSL